MPREISLEGHHLQVCILQHAAVPVTDGGRDLEFGADSRPVRGSTPYPFPAPGPGRRSWRVLHHFLTSLRYMRNAMEILFASSTMAIQNQCNAIAAGKFGTWVPGSQRRTDAARAPWFDQRKYPAARNWRKKTAPVNVVRQNPRGGSGDLGMSTGQDTADRVGKLPHTAGIVCQVCSLIPAGFAMPPAPPAVTPRWRR